MKPSRFLYILILVILLFSFFGSFVFSQKDLEIEYPEIPGAPAPSPEITLPEYVVYIFNFSLIIGVIIASAVLLYGGARYIFSAGNPEAMKDAKSRISSGILGLIILFSSYLILITINPQLVSPEAEPIGPVSGIYLINADDEKFYIPESQNKISFDAVSLEFISPETELISVFISPEEEFDGENSTEIINQGTGSTASVSNVRSIYFLWSRPGVYLYANESFGTPPPPRLYQSTSENLGDFDNKTKSIKIKDIQGQPLYLVILFSEPYFEGENGIGAAVENHSSLNDVANEVSSIDVSRITKMNEATSTGGEVIFYDDIDCTVKENSYTIKPGDSSSGGGSVPSHLSWLRNYATFVDFTAWEVLSFKIEGNCWVIFNTKKDLSGRSEIFTKEGCYPNLKGNYTYHPHPEKRKPETAAVFYSPK